MPKINDDLLSGVGAISSAIGVFMAYIWNIGLFQLVFSFVAGSFSTYYIQRRLQNMAERKEAEKAHALAMRDNIYGPAYEKFNCISEKLKNFQNPQGDKDHSPIEGLKCITDNYLFLLSDEKIKNDICKLYMDLNDYQNSLADVDQAIKNAFYDIVRAEIPRVRRADLCNILFLFPDLCCLEDMTLREIVLKEIDISKLVQDNKQNDKEQLKVKTPNQGTFTLKNIGRFDSNIQKTVWKDARLLRYKEKKEALQIDISNIIPVLKKKIKNEKD